MRRSKKLKVMISSTVYGNEELLEQIYGVLKGYGYDVLMSHKGSFLIDPQKSNTENCLNAVECCDVYLGIINKRYGSIDEESGISITHREIRHAIQKGKLSWFLVQYDVTVAHELLKQFRFDEAGTRQNVVLNSNRILQDIRILDMFDDVREKWVQTYHNSGDVLTFLAAQFENIEGIRAMIKTAEETRKTQ